MIAKGSIKLRIMNELTEKSGDKPASICWKEMTCKKHEESMIECLKKPVKLIDMNVLTP